MKTIKLEYWNERPDNYTGIIEYSNGTKWWHLNGERHRIDGPAIEGVKGYKSWYLNGSIYSEDEYKTEMMKRNSTVGRLLTKRTQL